MSEPSPERDRENSNRIDFPRAAGLLWRYTKGTVITVFVCWHLFFMAVRNPLDIWERDLVAWAKKHSWWKHVKKPYDKVDYATWYYGNFTAADQGWSMFSPPMSKWAPFLAAKVYFTDGTFDRIFSENEVNPTSYFRVGGWRQRKLEDDLVYTKPEEVADSDDFELYRAWAMNAQREWIQQNPHDNRKIERIDLIKRWYRLPDPGDDPSAWTPPSEDHLATFSPDGQLLPPPENDLQ